MKAADGLLKIPMYGFTESLNISVSAAIILQEIVTRMRIEKVDWQLSTSDKQALELQWTRRSIKSINQIEEHFYKILNVITVYFRFTVKDLNFIQSIVLIVSAILFKTSRKR